MNAVMSALLLALSVSLAPYAVPPGVADVVEKAGRYVLDYGQRMALVAGREDYAQWVENPGQQRLQNRTLASEYVIVRVDDDWMGFRDVYTVDGKDVTDRKDRLERLFVDTPGTAVASARRIADESARYNVGVIQRNLNTPTTALFFLEPENQPRFKYERKGEEALDGVTAWKIQYKEVKHPTIIKTSSGKDMPVSGTAWIDPATGRVLKTHMQIQNDARVGPTSNSLDEAPRRGRALAMDVVHSSASVTVTYREEPRLGLLVPAEMLETYEGPRPNVMDNTTGTTKINCRATYSGFHRVEPGSR